jgi:dUTP pyrophosphatase
MTMINGKGVSIVPGDWEQGDNKMMIKVKLVEGGIMPVYKTKGAACADCYARVDVNIPAGKRALVPLGFCIELPEGYEAEIRPRSGNSKNGVDVCIGTVDCDYRGEVMACVVNNLGEGLAVEKGSRVCQMKIQKAEQFKFVEVEELSETERGSGGFGHTGLK